MAAIPDRILSTGIRLGQLQIEFRNSRETPAMARLESKKSGCWSYDRSAS